MMNIISQEEINTIHDLCKEYKIKNYTINSDGSIDVDGDVNIHRKEINSLPFRFNVVSGDFDCSYNGLTSLECSPKEVGGNFNCDSNELTSLEGSPNSVGGYFSCRFNKLTSLEFSPKEVTGDFYYSFNNLHRHFTDLFYKLNEEEKKIFIKYQHDMGIWDNVYDKEEAQLLYEEIKDGLL